MALNLAYYSRSTLTTVLASSHYATSIINARPYVQNRLFTFSEEHQLAVCTNRRYLNKYSHTPTGLQMLQIDNACQREKAFHERRIVLLRSCVGLHRLFQVSQRNIIKQSQVLLVKVYFGRSNQIRTFEPFKEIVFLWGIFEQRTQVDAFIEVNDLSIVVIIILRKK